MAFAAFLRGKKANFFSEWEELIFANNHARYDGECTGISKLFCVKIF
jgi:hypothetical protein